MADAEIQKSWQLSIASGLLAFGYRLGNILTDRPVIKRHTESIYQFERSYFKKD
jgi:hypothetical protein